MQPMIEFKLTRREKPPLIFYFKSVEDVKMFNDWLEELIKNVKAKTIEEMKK